MSTSSQNCLGRYELIREIARSNDIVYEAWDPQTHRRVAVKALNLPQGATDDQKLDRTARFEREARAAARLHHPHIVTLFDFGTDQGQPYLVLEFVEGDTLADYIVQKGPLDEDLARSFITQVLSALGFAHSQGVVHRDIKPSNIFVCPGQTLKIADLGIARIESEQAVTSNGQVFGTPAYMSPEQVKGLDVDRRADLWSAGVVLYQMLTGVQPFTGGSVLEIGSNIINKEADLSLIREALLREVVTKALAKEPDDRFSSAAEMINAIKKPAPLVVAVPAIPVPAVSTNPYPVPTTSKSRTLLAWAAICVIALSMGAGAALVHNQANRVAQERSAPHVERVAAKSVDDIEAEAWEHNSLHELVDSELFRRYAHGAQMDQLDTWFRTTMAKDYMAIEPPERTNMLESLLIRFAAAQGERVVMNHLVVPAPLPKNVSISPPPLQTFPGAVASAAPVLKSTPAVAPGAASVYNAPQAQPLPIIPPSPPVSQTRIAPASPPQDLTQNTAPEDESRRVWPDQRAPDLDDLVVLQKLHFHATGMRILPGGIREYYGPKGILRVR